MDIYEELGLQKVINAVGTYTVIGASRMSAQTLHDACEATSSYVEIEKLMQAVCRRIAEMTHNEGAFVCNSCSTAIYLATAAAVGAHCGKPFCEVTDEEIHRCEVVAVWGQHIPYDHAMEQLGVRIRFIGYWNPESAMDPQVMRRAINENTVMAYFAPRTPDGYYGEGCMNLEDFIRTAHEKNIPVLADGAAQLPPKSNLWRYTEMGCEMACFSGGKDLRGPQASGLIVGRREWIDRVSENGFPRYGCGRIMKIGREEIVALYSAVKQYMAQDEAARLQWCEAQVAYLQERLKNCAHFEAERCWPNQAGQPLPRAFVTLKNTNATPSQLRALLMRDNPGIFCYSENRQGVYINPMCLNEGDMAIIADRFAALDQEV